MIERRKGRRYEQERDNEDAKQAPRHAAARSYRLAINKASVGALSTTFGRTNCFGGQTQLTVTAFKNRFIISSSFEARKIFELFDPALAPPPPCFVVISIPPRICRV